MKLTWLTFLSSTSFAVAGCDLNPFNIGYKQIAPFTPIHLDQRAMDWVVGIRQVSWHTQTLEIAASNTKLLVQVTIYMSAQLRSWRQDFDRATCAIQTVWQANRGLSSALFPRLCFPGFMSPFCTRLENCWRSGQEGSIEATAALRRASKPPSNEHLEATMKTMKRGGNSRSFCLFALGAAVAMMLAACGGGSGSSGVIRPPDPPPTSPPPTAPPPATPIVETPNPAYSKHLTVTNTQAAHTAGLTGKGYRIGIVDSGVNRKHPALDDRVTHNLVYISGSRNDLSKDDVVGHGTTVAQIAAGTAFGQWPGGIAPGATIVSARIISDQRPDDDGSGEGNEVDGPLGLEPIHDDLIDRGVRIMNNSWGGLYWNDPDVTGPIAKEYRRFVVKHGGLVVFASGNAGFENPSDMAALPSQTAGDGKRPGADLERGWLAVTAIDPDNIHELDKDPEGKIYANACGISKNYCLAAPGTVTTTGTEDPPDAPQYWRWIGTSLAAPLVSGAAALVWEAFPYFNNDLVRQTLLGTAQDIGEPGVDNLFGYGLLDVGKAVKGPAKFDWGTVTVKFNGFTSRWSNPISGAGGLIKRGNGQLILLKPLTYRGETRVERGTLTVARSLPSATRVRTRGTLKLAGNVGGDLENHGVVALTGDATRINGDFRQHPGGTLSTLVGNRITVTRRATLDGKLEIAGLVDGYVHEDRETILTANDGISGVFGKLTEGPGVFLDAQLRYTDTQVQLDIERLEVQAVAQTLGGITPAGMAAASRVENAFERLDKMLASDGPNGVDPGLLRTAGEFQRIGSDDVARLALSSLSGELHANAASATFDSIDMGRRALSSRYDRIAGSSDTAGSWHEQLGQGGRGGFLGKGFQVDGWLMGLDQRLGASTVAGVAFGEAHARGFESGNLDHSFDRQTSGRLHLGQLLGNGYVMAQLGFGRFDRNLQRQLFTGRGWQGVGSRYSGNYRNIGAETGYRFELSNVNVTPYLGAEYTRVDNDGFVEAGANGFGLHTKQWSSDRSQAIAGVRYARTWGGLRLHGYGEWQHTLAANGFAIDAGFVGIDAWALLPGVNPLRAGGLFGVGLETRLSRDSTLNFGYDQRFGPRGDARMVSLQLTHAF